MTARTCLVHGEYSATGVCRWCEPEDTVQMEYIRPTAHRPTRYWPVKSVTREEAVEMFGEPEPVIEVATWSTPPADEMWEPIRIDAEHAALRWERVARRWNYKHRGGGGTEEGRAYVWRWWVEQMDRQSAGLPLAGPFPLGFYAW